MKEPKIRFKGFKGEWEKTSLGKLVKVYDGIHQTPRYTDKGIMFLSVENISTLKSNKFINEVDFNQFYKIYPEKGDILMTRIGDVGTPNVIEVSDKIAYYVSLALLKPIAINSYYLSACIQSPTFQYNLKLRTLTTAIPQKINKDEIGKVDCIYSPYKDEQEAIASYFTNLDSLIQSTAKKIESLKQIKAASLQSMFPQEGETKPRVRFKGFEGEWEKVLIKDIATINPKTNIPNVFEYVDLESVVGTELKLHRTETKQTAPSRAQRLARNGDIFYQTVRPYQKNNLYFNLNEDNFVFSSGYVQIRANLCGSFLFAVMQQDSFVQKVMDNCTGTSFPAINANVLGMLEIMTSKNIAEQTAIASYFTALDRQISLQTQRLEKLKQIKSACLDNMFV